MRGSSEQRGHSTSALPDRPLPSQGFPGNNPSGHRHLDTAGKQHLCWTAGIPTCSGARRGQVDKEASLNPFND